MMSPSPISDTFCAFVRITDATLVAFVHVLLVTLVAFVAYLTQHPSCRPSG